MHTALVLIVMEMKMIMKSCQMCGQDKLVRVKEWVLSSVIQYPLLSQS